MSRKHQGQGQRQNMQNHNRPNAQRSSSPNRASYDQNGHEMNHNHEGMQAGSHPRNFNQTYSQTYYDTDYDQDQNAAAFNPQGRSPRPSNRNFSGRMAGAEYGSTFNDYESNRSPLTYDRDEDTFSSRFSADRQGSTNERFGYPSNMNAWSGGDPSFEPSHRPGRMGPEYESWNQQSYGDTGSASFGSFGEDRANSQDWGAQSTQRGFLGKGPKGYKRSDDRIKEDVCETLSRNHRIDASDIEVNVEDAMVTLSGCVDNRHTKRAAEMCIENLSGVDDVKNEIKVKKAGEDWSDSQKTSGSSKPSMTNSTMKSTNIKNTGHN